MCATELFSNFQTARFALEPQVEEVLEEIAVYRTPNMTSLGQYALKREMWRFFDPHFLPFNKRVLSRAWERAVEVREGGRDEGREEIVLLLARHGGGGGVDGVGLMQRGRMLV